MLTLGNLFAPIVNPSRNIGAVANILVADSREDLKEAVEAGFQNDQARLSIAGICRDCYDGNFAPYIAEWMGSDKARDHVAPDEDMNQVQTLTCIKHGAINPED